MVFFIVSKSKDLIKLVALHFQLYVILKLETCYFYIGLEIFIRKRFDDITIGKGNLGFIDCGDISIGGQINNRNIVFLPDKVGRFNPCKVTLEHDVHEDNIG